MNGETAYSHPETHIHHPKDRRKSKMINASHDLQTNRSLVANP